jgi:nucleoside 2-deoxyribosyltransferase
MKILVCGSIGYGGMDRIRDIQTLLRNEGITVIDQISEEGMDYSDIKDFRDKPEIAAEIVEHDLKFVEKSDVIVVVSNGPSYGTAIEMYIAKQRGKKVITLCEDEVPTPWLIFLSNYTVKTKRELIDILRGDQMLTGEKKKTNGGELIVV